MTSTSDRIVKCTQVNAPRPRVWQAITDSAEFGKWFRVKLNGPFLVGESTEGNILYPGYEHLVMKVDVVDITPMSRFAFQWHPYAIDPSIDYTQEPPTLVEFLLEEAEGGTKVTVIESGFDALPAHRRDEAFRMNEGGWTIQVKNIQSYVEDGQDS